MRTKGSRESKLWNAKTKFSRFRSQAKYRKVPFNMEFDEWYQLWLSVGVDKQQDQTWGNSNRLCMSRIDLKRGFVKDNIHFITNKQNAGRRDKKMKPGAVYRWGTQFPISHVEIEDYMSDPVHFKHLYRLENYDKNRCKEFDRNLKRWRKSAKTLKYRIHYQGADGVFYKTVALAADTYGCTHDTYNRRHKVEKLTGESFSEYQTFNSKFPDPIVSHAQAERVAREAGYIKRTKILKSYGES